MTRPESYRRVGFPQCCENCQHSVRIRYRDDLVCVKNDSYHIDPFGHLIISDVDVSACDDETYKLMTGKRIVDGYDVCDEFQKCE